MVGENGTNASLIFQCLYLIPQSFPLRWVSDGCLGRTWARRTAWEALVLVREVGGDLNDLLSRGMVPHVKRSALRREWQSEYIKCGVLEAHHQ